MVFFAATFSPIVHLRMGSTALGRRWRFLVFGMQTFHRCPGVGSAGGMPSTMKCSQDDNLCVLACSDISGRIAAAASASSNRCRFLANSECSKLRSIMFEYENHLNSPPGADTTALCRTAARCTENTPINTPAFNRHSDSISARPLAAYIRVKVGESLDNARSTLGLSAGWVGALPSLSSATPRYPDGPSCHTALTLARFSTPCQANLRSAELPGYVDGAEDGADAHHRADAERAEFELGDDGQLMMGMLWAYRCSKAWVPITVVAITEPKVRGCASCAAEVVRRRRCGTKNSPRPT